MMDTIDHGASTACRRAGDDGIEDALFEARDVEVVADGRHLLQLPDLAIAPGRVVGIIGHNGSGKSTLLQLLARQRHPSTGSIRFEGRPLPQWPARDWARRVAFLPQKLPATPAMTVAELTALGRYPWHGAFGRFGGRDREKVAQAMEATGTTELADRFVDTLSGGERQRAWLAMLIAQDARCLVLDEPTAALDIGHQIGALRLIGQLCQDRRVSVLIVLHDLNMAARYCDELIALHSGSIVARGCPADIVRSDVLARIYGIAMETFPHPATGIPIAYVA